MKQKISDTKQKTAGFTIVELIVVMTIFSIMASIVLFKFNDFNKIASLDSLTEDIALRLVAAQKSAISGINNVNFATGVAPSYGVYFQSGASSGTADKKFIYFTDIPVVGSTPFVGDKLYSTAPATSPCGPSVSGYSAECLSVTSITTGEYVSRICYSTGSTTYACSSSTVPSPYSAQITFVRPFPDATIRVCTNPASCAATPPALDTQNLLLEVTSGTNALLKKTIIVNNLGEVRVYNGSAYAACMASGTGFSCPA